MRHRFSWWRFKLKHWRFKRRANRLLKQMGLPPIGSDYYKKL